MQQGYFAGMLAFLYRETVDGQRVVARRIAPLLPARWLLVTPENQARFERRHKQSHVAAMLALALAAQSAGDDASLWRMIGTVFVVGSVAMLLAQWWATAGLPRYEGGESSLVPVTRSEISERQARAMGPRTRVAFVIVACVLAIPALLAALVEGYWLGWVGVVLWGGMAVYFWRQHVRIRDGAERGAASAAS